MISEEMMALGKKRSVIREIFEYGKIRASEIGRENVFDFSLGNPNVPPPDCVREAILDLLNTEDSVALHGYTSAQGDAKVRQTIADYINATYGTQVGADNLYMTAGAAASLSICLKALAVPGDEFIAFTPFFPEYRVFTEAAGGKLVVVPSRDGDFQIDIPKVCRGADRTDGRGVTVNSPNNPSGVVLSEDNFRQLCDVMREKEARSLAIPFISSRMNHTGNWSMKASAFPTCSIIMTIPLSVILSANRCPCPESGSVISSSPTKWKRSGTCTPPSAGSPPGPWVRLRSQLVPAGRGQVRRSDIRYIRVQKESGSVVRPADKFRI